MEKLFNREFIITVFTILICILLCFISKKTVYRFFKMHAKSEKDGKKKTIVNLISHVVKFVIISVSILTILETYGVDTKSLVASFGVVGLVAGLALQDLLKDFIIGITIIFEGQYSIGDWVSINGFKGEVLPSSLRVTKLKSYTGEIKIISNRNITEIINYSLSSANLFVDIDVSYESDIEKVKEVLDNLCDTFKNKYKLKSISCLGIQELANSSIRYRITAACDYSEQFALDRQLKKEIVLEFNKNNITIPYNQVVVHNG